MRARVSTRAVCVAGFIFIFHNGSIFFLSLAIVIDVCYCCKSLLLLLFLLFSTPLICFSSVFFFYLSLSVVACKTASSFCVVVVVLFFLLLFAIHTDIYSVDERQENRLFHSQIFRIMFNEPAFHLKPNILCILM